MVKDPVCGMEVDEQKAKEKTQYEGKTYYFCSRSCRQEFEQNPQNYVTQSAA
jgi:YHS domain-containing protein